MNVRSLPHFMQLLLMCCFQEMKNHTGNQKPTDKIENIIFLEREKENSEGINDLPQPGQNSIIRMKISSHLYYRTYFFI